MSGIMPKQRRLNLIYLLKAQLLNFIKIWFVSLTVKGAFQQKISLSYPSYLDSIDSFDCFETFAKTANSWSVEISYWSFKHDVDNYNFAVNN